MFMRNQANLNQQNQKTNLKKLSNRSERLLQSASQQTEQLSHYEVKLDMSDKFLTLLYPAKSVEHPPELYLVINETICTLMKHKDLNQLSLFSFREAENFLRDENHLPAFGTGTDLEREAESLFIRSKWSFFSAGLMAFAKKHNWKIRETNVPGETYANKNADFATLFSLLKKAFTRGEKLHFVLWEDDTLFVKTEDPSWSADELTAFFQAISRAFELGPAIKVVAVQ